MGSKVSMCAFENLKLCSGVSNVVRAVVDFRTNNQRW